MNSANVVNLYTFLKIKFGVGIAAINLYNIFKLLS